MRNFGGAEPNKKFKKKLTLWAFYGLQVLFSVSTIFLRKIIEEVDGGGGDMYDMVLKMMIGISHFLH